VPGANGAPYPTKLIVPVDRRPALEADAVEIVAQLRLVLCRLCHRAYLSLHNTVKRALCYALLLNMQEVQTENYIRMPHYSIKVNKLYSMQELFKGFAKTHLASESHIL
jgi:hypothetical protein